MRSLSCFRFSSNGLFFFFVLLSMALFVRLGFWQLQRADEKTRMLTAQESLAGQKAVSWEPEQALPLPYQKVVVQGSYLPSVFLLDNQHHQHQFGYDVLSPLLLKDGSVVMVDRGWVLGESSRLFFPKVSVPSAAGLWHGSAYFPSKNPWIFGAILDKKENNMFIVERIDAEMLKHILQKKVHPFIIRLDKKEPEGFVREWAIVSMPPQRHTAYAVQWFAMALAILIVFLALHGKKK